MEGVDRPGWSLIGVRLNTSSSTSITFSMIPAVLYQYFMYENQTEKIIELFGFPYILF